MSHDAERAVIAKLQGEIAKLMNEVKGHKTTINFLLKTISEPPMYTDLGDDDGGGKMVRSSDEFYGKPLATVVKVILDRRKSASLGAASVPDIYRIMKDGGYLFEAKNDDNAKRGVYIALSKNPAFHKLPNGDYGLREWYPTIKDRKAKAESSQEDADHSHKTIDDENASESDMQAAGVGSTPEAAQAKARKAK